jgi:GNAT superfamily N-acetyltransferase
MRLQAASVPLASILAMREAYRREMACQIVHDSWHARGFTDSYLLRVDDTIAGYGCVGGAPGEPRHTIKEFHLLPAFRGSALRLFGELIAASGARRIEAQTNDRLLLLMLLDCGVELSSPTILFADGFTTQLTVPDATFRSLDEAEREHVFQHTHEPVGEYALEIAGVVVATGGIVFRYNPPFGDLYMEVAEPNRRTGLGSYLVQELKRVCHELDRVPTARCSATNHASRATLQRAGMFPCARIVEATIAVEIAAGHTR